MKIAFVSLYQAYPPISGAAYVTYHCARLTPCNALLVQFADRTRVECDSNLTISSLQQSPSSRLAKLIRMPFTILHIRREVARFRPDYVVLEGASWAVYLLLVALVLRTTMSGAKIVYHAHNVEYLLRIERNGRLIAAITRGAEKAVLSLCHQRFAVSREDCRHFSTLYGINARLLPNGVDCNTSRVSDAEINSARKRFALTAESILFMGLYAYPPNSEAVRFLIEEVMPELHRERPNARLVVTSDVPPISAPWLIKTGLLSRQDLNALLCACRVGVAPIFRGSGTRLKILEYMAAGLPVVSTRKGAEGLDLKNGTHILFAETGAEFRDCLQRLFADKLLSESLSGQAAQLARAKFDWAPLLRQFAADLVNG